MTTQKGLWHSPMTWETPWLLPGDTIPSDRQLEEIEARRKFALVIERGKEAQANTRPPATDTLSYVTGGLFVMLIVICLRYRKNTRYFNALLSDLTDVRERHNAFDDTVRETSFLLLLNIMWCLCGGVLLYGLLTLGGTPLPIGGLTLPAAPAQLHARPALCMVVCMGVTLVYSLMMTLAYSVVGNVFSDRVRAGMWVKGFASAQGLCAIVFFPLALIEITTPYDTLLLLLIALCAYAITKIIFIYKGFRIFFSQTSSWVLFLYYLCSLEIVPLILTYLASLQLCSLL